MTVSAVYGMIRLVCDAQVTAWVRQHQQRLSSALAELLDTQELLEKLLSWLQWAETTLGEEDKEPLPQELEEVKTLIAEHQVPSRAVTALHS